LQTARPEGLSEGRAAQQFDGTRFVPTDSVLWLIGKVLMFRPGQLLPANVDSACDEPGSIIVCILSSRPDVLSAIVRHVYAALGRKYAVALKCGPTRYIHYGLL